MTCTELNDLIRELVRLQGHILQSRTMLNRGDPIEVVIKGDGQNAYSVHCSVEPGESGQSSRIVLRPDMNMNKNRARTGGLTFTHPRRV